MTQVQCDKYILTLWRETARWYIIYNISSPSTLSSPTRRWTVLCTLILSSLLTNLLRSGSEYILTILVDTFIMTSLLVVSWDNKTYDAKPNHMQRDFCNQHNIFINNKSVHRVCSLHSQQDSVVALRSRSRVFSLGMLLAFFKSCCQELSSSCS